MPNDSVKTVAARRRYEKLRSLPVIRGSMEIKSPNLRDLLYRNSMGPPQFEHPLYRPAIHGPARYETLPYKAPGFEGPLPEIQRGPRPGGPGIGGLENFPTIQRGSNWADIIAKKRALLPNVPGQKPISRGPFNPQRAAQLQAALAKFQTPARRRLLDLLGNRNVQIHQ